MSSIVPAISGPKRPQDYVRSDQRQSRVFKRDGRTSSARWARKCRSKGENYTMESGKVVIASITSCTNTSNPYVMIGAGLVARKAAACWG